MNTRSNFSAISAARSLCCGSKGCASMPLARNAFNTMVPLLSDTSRSAERPPSSTATLPKALAFMRAPPPFRCRRVCVGAVGVRRQSRPVASPQSGGAPASCSCRLLPDDAHFGHEFDTVLRQHGMPHMLDQVFDVVSAPAPLCIDDEVGMLFRHARTADGITLQACL